MATKKKAPNPLLLDPTRTAKLRRPFEAQLKRRFQRLKARLVELIVEEDVFGLTERPSPLGLNYNPAQPRDKAGRWSRVAGALGSIAGKAGHAEHAAKTYLTDKVGAAVARLPKPAQAVAKGTYALLRAATKVAFANWTAGQALVERVARERGFTAEQAKKLRGTVAKLDLATFKTFKVAALAGFAPAKLPAAISASVPLASAGYLAYSTARNPLATLRAARGVVKDTKEAINRRLPKRSKKSKAARTALGVEELSRNVNNHLLALVTNGVEEQLGKLADAFAAHQWSDWYDAILSVAMDETETLNDALALADEAYRSQPYDPTPSPRNDDAVAVFGAEVLAWFQQIEPDELQQVHEVFNVTYDQRVVAGLASRPGESNQDYEEAGLREQPAPLAVPDAQGLGSDLPFRAITANAREWEFLTSPEKLKQFQNWLAGQFREEVAGPDERALWEKYVQDGFQQGAGRAYDDFTRRQRASGLVPAERVQGARQQFLSSSFNQPETVEKVQLLASRIFEELDGVTKTMSTKMSRVLADGLVQGQNPRQIASTLSQEVDLGQSRALTISRTELIRAHSEGQLDALEALGVTELGVLVEWSATNDLRVCRRCAAMQGVVFKISEAKGLLPRHPNCRCAFIPAGVGESTAGQKRTAKQVAAAIKESTKGEGDSPWVGEDKLTQKGTLKKDVELPDYAEEPETELEIDEQGQPVAAEPEEVAEAPASTPLSGHPLEHLSAEERLDWLTRLVNQPPGSPVTAYPQPSTAHADIKAKVLEQIDLQRQRNAFQRLTIEDVYAKVREDFPGLTLYQFEGELLQMQKDDRIILGPYTQGLATLPREKLVYVMPVGRDAKFYLQRF